MNDLLTITVRNTKNRCKSYLMTLPNTELGNLVWNFLKGEYRKEGKKLRRLPRGKRKAAFIKQSATNPESWEYKTYNKYIVNGQWVGGGHPWNFTYRPKLADRENCTRFDVYFA